MRPIAVSLLLVALLGCALDGMVRDGIVDLEAPLEKRQKGVAKLIRDLQGNGEEERARAAEILPQYGFLAVPPLVEMAAAGDLEDRLLAISTLGEMGAESREALPFLIEALEDEDEFIRLTAAEAVGRIPVVGKGSIPALITALSDTSPFVRNQAAVALVSLYRLRLEDSDPFVRVDTVRNLEVTGSAGVPLLLEILKGEDGYLRPAAAEVLSTTGGGSEMVVEGLVGALGQGEYTLSRRVLEALHQIGPNAAPALPAVVYLLGSGDPTLVEQSIRTIGSMGPVARSAAQDIMPFLESRDVYTRWYAAKALFDLGLRLESAIPVFIEALRRGDWTYGQSLEYLKPFGERALPYLLPLLADESAVVRRGASLSIGMSGASPDRIFPRLIKMLGDDNFYVLAETVRVMAEAGSDSPELSVPYLLPALESADPHVRFGSAAVLVMIDPDSSEARRVLIEGISSGLKTVYYLVSVGLLSLDEEGVKIAIDSLMDDDVNTRWGAAAILGFMGEKAVGAVPALMMIVSEESSLMSLAAIRSLRSIGPGARTAVPLLVDALDDHRSYIRDAAESAIRSIDPSVLSELSSFD